MSRKLLLLCCALFLLNGMEGLAAAGTHADCIKDCIDKRTAEGVECKRQLDASVKQCDASESACIAAAKDDAAKRACRKANRECKSDAQDDYSGCIKQADAAVKTCKDNCPPDNNPNLPSGNLPGNIPAGSGRPLQSAPAR